MLELSLDDFFARFEVQWNSARTSFWKIEARQTYAEPDDPSYKAFLRGDSEQSKALLRERIFAQREMYQRARENGVSFVRIRIVERPITDYMRYEYDSYPFSAELGERILFVERSGIDSARVPSGVELRDLLLFDSEHLFLHRYSPKGELQGAFAVEDASLAKAYAEFFEYLVTIGTPLEDYKL